MELSGTDFVLRTGSPGSDPPQIFSGLGRGIQGGSQGKSGSHVLVFRAEGGNQSEASQMLFAIRCILYYRLAPGVCLSINPDVHDSKPVPFRLDDQTVETLAMTQPDCI